MEDWLTARTKASPHKIALIFGDRHWSYEELNTLVNIGSARLAKMVQPGQHVGVLMSNSHLYVCLIHALARIGAVLVPLNIRLTDFELLYQIDHSDCDFLVMSDEMFESQADLALNERRLLRAEELFDPYDGGESILSNAFRMENPQAIMFTSGTTGQPKGAVLTFANHFWSAASSAFRLGMQVNDRWLSCLPLYHVGGLAIILRSCLYGTTVVLHDRFDERAISESLDKQAITQISLVPTMVLRLLDFRQGQPWPTSLRHLLLGGAAAPVDLIERCLELEIPLTPTYGLTEAASQVATMLPKETMAKPGSVGKPLLFTKVEIIDDQGHRCSDGSVGEIVVSGPTVMSGYYQDQRATEETLMEGRLYSGDTGFLDQDGDLWLVQRRNDIIISGGENVYPSEVENVFLQHPSIFAICVVGIPDQEWGQRVAAMIVLYPGEEMTREALYNFGRKKLASYKLPRKVRFVDKLPLTASGKIHRRLIIEQIQQHSGLAPSDENASLSKR